MTDLLVGLAVLHSALAFRNSSGPGSLGRARIAPMPAVFVLFVVYVTTRALLSLGGGDVLDWIRDAAPYFYALLAVMSATSYVASSPARRRATGQVLVVGLAVHLGWTVLFHFTPSDGQDSSVTFFGATLFQVRPDIDAALNAVLAAYCVRAIIVHRRRVLSLIGLALAVTWILFQGTRAGTLSLILCLTVSFVVTYSGLGRLDGRRVAMTLAAPAILMAAVIFLPLTGPGQRIVATVFPDQATGEQQQNAEGTANARGLVWTGVINWTVDSTPRLLIGSGFGDNFLQESNTLQYLEGTDFTNVRSPHDYWIGSFARLGLPGIVLLLGSVLLAIGVIVRARVRIAADQLSFLAAIIVVAIVPVASLGVVLESPFGAVPFFWAVGVIYTFRTPRQPDAPRRREVRQAPRADLAARPGPQRRMSDDA